MAGSVLASFTARDGSGLWEVTNAGVHVGGRLWRFTDTSFVICAVTPGHDERQTRVIEEQDGFGAWAGLAVLQETGSLKDAALTAWAFGGPSTHVEVEHREIAGTAQLTIGNLRGPRTRGDLRYREDGRHVQEEALRRFAAATKQAISAHKAQGII